MISNTGPLMSALQCDRLDLLQRYIDRLYIPLSVQTELERHGFGSQAQVSIEEGWIVPILLTQEETKQAHGLARRIAASPLTNDKKPASHLPEAEAIVLFERAELGAARILIEELAAREVSRAENAQTAGFVGVLLLACEERVLTPDEMRQLLHECRRKGTHYGSALIDEVCSLCERLRE